MSITANDPTRAIDSSDHHHIFMSYAREDTHSMQRVANSLRQANLKVWTDENLKPGTKSWSKAIEKALDVSACLVVLLSPEAKDSEWVDREITYAMSILDIPIFPVLVRGTLRIIPYVLAHAQYVDIRERFEEEIAKLLDAIQASIGIGQSLDAPTIHSPHLDKASIIDTYQDAYFTERTNDWPLLALGELVEKVSYGRGVLPQPMLQIPGSYPVYRASGLIEYSDFYRLTGTYILIVSQGSQLLRGTNPIVQKVGGRFSADQNFHILKPNPDYVIADYLEHFLNYSDIVRFVTSFSKPKLNWSTLSELPIALPPLSDQLEIVSMIDEQISLIEQTRTNIKTQLEMLDQFEKAVLRRGLRGE